MTLFETFLQQLAQVLQFPNLAPDAQGACLIMMKEGQVPLLFEFDDQLVPNTILLSSPVASFSIERRAAVYDTILKGNIVQEETLSVKPDEDIVYLHRRLHPNIQAADLEPVIQQFVQSVKMWKTNIESLEKNILQEGKIPSPTSIQVFPYKA